VTETEKQLDLEDRVAAFVRVQPLVQAAKILQVSQFPLGAGRTISVVEERDEHNWRYDAVVLTDPGVPPPDPVCVYRARYTGHGLCLEDVRVYRQGHESWEWHLEQALSEHPHPEAQLSEAPPPAVPDPGLTIDDLMDPSCPPLDREVMLLCLLANADDVSHVAAVTEALWNSACTWTSDEARNCYKRLGEALFCACDVADRERLSICASTVLRHVRSRSVRLLQAVVDEQLEATPLVHRLKRLCSVNFPGLHCLKHLVVPRMVRDTLTFHEAVESILGELVATRWEGGMADLRVVGQRPVPE